MQEELLNLGQRSAQISFKALLYVSTWIQFDI